MVDLLSVGKAGLYCNRAPVWIDPQIPVANAFITHAHSDHARPGHGRYWCAASGAELLRLRVGHDAAIEAVPYGEVIGFHGLDVSFHPAGHILGSAMIRVSDGSTTWLCSGDYGRQADRSCEPWAPVACDYFITESTFALPVYRWPDPQTVFADIFQWWQDVRQSGRTAVLFAYALGKTQRLLAGLQDFTSDMVWLHGAAVELTQIYRNAGITMLPTQPVTAASSDQDWRGQLVIAPPSAAGSPWLYRFGKDVATGFASGWMTARGVRRRRGYDRGFILSDHVDWPQLLTSIHDVGAKRVFVTHGWAKTVARYLREHQDIDAEALNVLYDDEDITLAESLMTGDKPEVTH